MGSIISAAPLLKKVYIPKYIFPLEKCCFAMVNCVFSFVALLLVMVFTGSPFHLTVFQALYPLVTLFFFSLGVSLFLAACTVFFRDIQHIWSVFITALLYFSAIFYDPAQMTFSIGGFNMQQVIAPQPHLLVYHRLPPHRHVGRAPGPADGGGVRPVRGGVDGGGACGVPPHPGPLCAAYLREEEHGWTHPIQHPSSRSETSRCASTLASEKHESLKEYFLAMVQGRLHYDEFYALRDVSLNIMPGDFYGLVGLNGSGKSTLLKDHCRGI